MSVSLEVRVLATPQELFQAAAKMFVSKANAAVERQGRFTVALSGGSTPKGLYTLLATDFQSSIPWERIFFFWGDERHVPPGHPDSNYRMAYTALLSKVPVPPQNVFRIPAEDQNPDAVAEAYEKTLRGFFQLRPGQLPRFDLLLLGMGPDGHTASLFPGTRALEERARLVAPNWVEKFKAYRITLTLPALNHSACIVFLVSGEDKATTLRSVLEGNSSAEQLPASMVRPTDGRLLWLLDRTAAGGLKLVP